MARAAAAPANLACLAAGPVLVAYAVGALVVARASGRFTTYAGASNLATALAAVAGLGLIATGLFVALSRRSGTGVLFLLAGFVWFAPVWVGWEGGPPVVRSLGMIAAGFSLPLFFHLVLAQPNGLRSAVARVFVAAVYLEAALSALGRALFRDPFLDPNAWDNYTANVFLVHAYPSFANAIHEADTWFAVAAAAILATIYASRFAVASGAGRRAMLPVLGAALALAAATTAHSIALQRTPLENPADPLFATIFAAGCAAAIVLALGLAVAGLHARVQRRAVARIVADLGEAPAPGSLESALARALGDRDLRIAYWLRATQRYADALGRPVAEPVAEPGQVVTTLIRGGSQVAAVTHSTALPELERELGAATRLALENERLQAEVRAQLADLRTSRARIVETADAERRRLERDLHDGAQQRLLALSYDIRVADTTARAEGEHATVQLLLGEATDEAKAGLDELRELAHGIYPAILAEAGLAAALRTLAESAPLPVEIRKTSEKRCPAAVETAAYAVVAGALEDAVKRGASYAAVSAAPIEGELVVEVGDDGSRRTSAMIRLGDRVGALGGRLEVEPTTVRAHIPLDRPEA